MKLRSYLALSAKILTISALVLLTIASVSYHFEEKVMVTRGTGIKANGNIISHNSLWIGNVGWLIPDRVHDSLDFKISMPSPLPKEKSRFLAVDLFEDTLILRGGKIEKRSYMVKG